MVLLPGKGRRLRDQYSSFLRAAEDHPIALAIVRAQEVEGLTAVPVRKGDLLPNGATGVVPAKDIADGKRVALAGDHLVLRVPTETKEQNGIPYLDSYRHKNVETNPWSGAWTIVMVVSLGFALGMLAQSVTDCLGIDFWKADHNQSSGTGH